MYIFLLTKDYKEERESREMDSSVIVSIRTRSPNTKHKKPEDEQDYPVACRTIPNSSEHNLFSKFFVD